MPKKFKHGSLNIVRKNKLIFLSSSKRNYYFRDDATAFVLKDGNTPIGPFMNFDYNLRGLVKKDLVRIANNTLVQRCDELWVFGEISDGVLAEVYTTKRQKKPIRFFIYNETQKTFKEIGQDQVELEDISPWMWEWIKNNKNLERWHPRLRFKKTYPVIYPAYSKRNFYLQMHISKFCLEKKKIPLNPFMLFRYFLGDSVPRKTVYLANNNIVWMSDEVWVFGEVSDGVLAEVKMKKDQGQPVKYFKIAQTNPVVFRRILPKSVEFEEEELKQYRYLL
jgi:hypothetical protein